jgi:hypothetical protein
LAFFEKLNLFEILAVFGGLYPRRVTPEGLLSHVLELLPDELSLRRPWLDVRRSPVLTAQ